MRHFRMFVRKLFVYLRTVYGSHHNDRDRCDLQSSNRLLADTSGDVIYIAQAVPVMIHNMVWKMIFNQ